ncbi:hypothetical protein AGR4A_Cc30274 [Agrobacterium tumefaciens str. B6]|uniref:Uncharacterized protein n=2 Tax=Agrobacterium tumefaciens TaxID=358 RepID=A0A822V227_AGRTU|nr:hypothetical protein AGR4C_Cc30011 [Agrobacterium tumefaciens str. Kerr 14]CVI18227.1 hypothetical protein AGR4A_Cc30274 [Agrobacterium tumefaciens str. B6]
MGSENAGAGSRSLSSIRVGPECFPGAILAHNRSLCLYLNVFGMSALSCQYGFCLERCKGNANFIVILVSLLFPCGFALEEPYGLKRKSA